nr:hypothetical protein [Tanacetum cinerariifolium]
ELDTPFPMEVDMPYPMEVDMPYRFIDQKSLEYGRYGVSQVLDMAYQGFLGVGNTFDIFENILLPYSLNTAYCLPLYTAYWILFPLWSLVSAGTNTSYLP